MSDEYAIYDSISIHALLWSATWIFTNGLTQVFYFYPRTPVECDVVTE